MPKIIHLNNLESARNKTNIIDKNSTAEQYPTAKAVYEVLDGPAYRDFIYIGRFNSIEELQNFQWEDTKLYLVKTSGQIGALGIPGDSYIVKYYEEITYDPDLDEDLVSARYLHFRPVIETGKSYLLNIGTTIVETFTTASFIESGEIKLNQLASDIHSYLSSSYCKFKTDYYISDYDKLNSYLSVPYTDICRLKFTSDYPDYNVLEDDIYLGIPVAAGNGPGISLISVTTDKKFIYTKADSSLTTVSHPEEYWKYSFNRITSFENLNECLVGDTITNSARKMFQLGFDPSFEVYDKLGGDIYLTFFNDSDLGFLSPPKFVLINTRTFEMWSYTAGDTDITRVSLGVSDEKGRIKMTDTVTGELYSIAVTNGQIVATKVES